MKKPSGRLSPQPAPEFFNEQERVRLTFLLQDMLPPSRTDILGRKISGYEWDFLYEALQRKLGRKEIGYALDIVGAIEDFVTKRANEDELLTMLELMPTAYVRAFQHTHQRYELPDRAPMERMIGGINEFLERIGSPARFTKDFTFIRDGFLDETPPALKNLPTRERLYSDLQILCSQVNVVAVILIDLDHFKDVNDQHGHAAGDKCLEIVVHALGETVARKGKLYRYGAGDEFVVVLPNFSALEGAATAERLRKAIELANPGDSIKVTASVGVAASDIVGIMMDGLIESADAAMYSSKKSRNCVTVWMSGMVSAAR